MTIRLFFACLLTLTLFSPLRGDDAKPTSQPAAAPSVLPAKEKFHLYLLMGQSNMVGRDTRTLADQVDDPRVLAVNADGVWVIARDPIHAQNGRIAPGVGPGISFGRSMAAASPGVSVGLIPCAVGSTPLRRWEKGGDLYQIALDRAKAAERVGTLRGVLWHQGEADAAKQANAESYEHRLVRMIDDLRRDLGRPDLPVVVGQLGDFIRVEKLTSVDTVRRAIKAVAGDERRVGFVDSAGLTDKGDALHFDAASQAELGRRYAAEMTRLQGGRSASPAADNH